MVRNVSILYSFIYILIFSSCSNSVDKTEHDLEKFPVIYPIIKDTVITKEYVADIHSMQNVEIRARVKGFIEKIYVDEGKEVKAGQILFSLSDDEYEQELIKAGALLKSAIAEAKEAELKISNVQILVDKKVVSETELELAKSKLDAANAKIEEAKSNQAQAQLNLSYTQVKAPFDGIIDRIPNKTGSFIDEGMLLTTISNNKEMFIYFSVSEKEYLDYTHGKNLPHYNEVNLQLVNNEIYPYAGTIETVEGEFNRETGNIAFRARFPNPDRILKHGSSGKVFIKKQIHHAMLIPQKSTFEIQENNYVYIVDRKNMIHLNIIEPKYRIDNMYIINSGLKENDKILFEGVQLVNDGDEISPQIISSSEALKKLN